MKLNKSFSEMIEKLKLLIKYIILGFVVIFSLGVGFLILVWGAFCMPLVRWFRNKFNAEESQYDKKGNKHKKGKVIDAEYEVIDD